MTGQDLLTFLHLNQSHAWLLNSWSVSHASSLITDAAQAGAARPETRSRQSSTPSLDTQQQLQYRLAVSLVEPGC